MKHMGFKRLLSWTLCLVLTLCATTALAGDTTVMTAGTYTGTGDGFGGKITVTVTVEDNKITDIAVGENSETDGIGSVALEKLPQQILELQGLGLDAVAGSTYSSNGLLAAVKDALTQAGADITALEAIRPEKTASGDAVEMTADVVVVGGGGAGLAAALAAAEQGAKVIVLEKTASLGGTTLLSGAYYATGNQEVSKKAEMNDKMRSDVDAILALEPLNDDMARWQEAVRQQYADYNASGATYMFDSEEYHMLQVYADGNFTADTALIERYCAASYECYQWLEKNGFVWSDEVIGGKASDSGTVTLDAQRARRNKGDGSGRNSQMMIDALKNAGDAAQTPVEYLMEVAGKELIVTDGRVTGVKAEGTDGTQYIINAGKGVVLATGGIGGNVELMNKYNEWYPEIPADFATDNSAGDTGDGLLMAEAIGVELIDMEKLQMFVYGTKYSTGVAPYVSNYTNMLVNNSGKRFVNETASDRELSAAMLAQPDYEVYILSDANSSAITDGKNASGYDIEELIAKGVLFRADSIEELAGMIGADPAVLTDSVERFNAACDAGYDEEFGRDSFLGSEKLTEAPFYAALNRSAEHHSMGGIHIDTEMRALTADGSPFPGLYAAGEICGGLQGDDRISGNAILEAICGGMIAGANAAQGK